MSSDSTGIGKHDFLDLVAVDSIGERLTQIGVVKRRFVDIALGAPESTALELNDGHITSVVQHLQQ